AVGPRQRWTPRAGCAANGVFSRPLLRPNPGERHGTAILHLNSLLSSKSGRRMAQAVCAFGAALAMVGHAGAHEGVGTFDTPPAAALKSGYGFTPSVEWLDALRLSAVRLGGGSGSFVSANGLVLTNHHVAMGCLQALSTAADDLVRNGFHAR